MPWDTRSELAAKAVAGLNGHSHQWEHHLHLASVLVRKSEQHHCDLCSGCGGLRCEVDKQLVRPVVDDHTRLVQQLHIILDKAAVEYDGDEGVVEDFIGYVKDWANRRKEQEVPRRWWGGDTS